MGRKQSAPIFERKIFFGVFQREISANYSRFAEKRRAQYLNCPWRWWFRSPGRKQAKAAYVHGDGNIGIQGNNAYKCNLNSVYHPVTNDVKGRVRPALWIKLCVNIIK